MQLENIPLKTKFAFAVGIQVLILLTVIAYKLAILSGGTEVFLRIQPVDPRDPLRGDYAVFSYDISNVAGYYFKNGSVSNGETVYVTLTKSGKYWRVGNASEQKPKEGVFLKGKVNRDGSNNSFDSLSGRTGRNENIHLEYGIENYFIPEGKGRNFSFTNKEAGALVRIDNNGNAVLDKIYVDDKPWP
jgi:uncharacterized membrane-anchored protein